MPNRCFVCEVFTPCYRFAGQTICGDCAADGGVLYSEGEPDAFFLDFARREVVRRIFSIETGEQSKMLIGQVVRLHKLKLEAELDKIARGEARLLPAPRHTDTLEEAA